MKRITVNDVMDKNPCYAIERVEKLFGKRKTVGLKDILEMKIPNIDKVWVISKFMDKQHQKEILEKANCIVGYVPDLYYDSTSIDRTKVPTTFKKGDRDEQIIKILRVNTSKY